MRLIDADRMRNDDSMCEGVLCDECPFADRLRSKCSFVDFMDRQPTVDPVKHGRWIAGYDSGNKYWPDRWVCSECGAAFDTADYNYCPDCGARMDGDEE